MDCTAQATKVSRNLVQALAIEKFKPGCSAIFVVFSDLCFPGYLQKLQKRIGNSIRKGSRIY